MRYPSARGLAALTPLASLAFALAACSGQGEPAAPPSQESTSDATAPTFNAAPEPVASEAAPESEAAPQEPATTPSPTPTPTSTPTPTKTAPPPSPTPAPPAAPEPVASAGPPAAFGRCAVCHNAEKGAPDKLGPNLYGIFGHKMGQGSFAFSDALKNSGLTMDEATLDQWLENPRKLVPGNRMSFPGLKDPAKRQEIIDYLKKQR